MPFTGPRTAPALGLRAGSDGLFNLSQTRWRLHHETHVLASETDFDEAPARSLDPTGTLPT
jgi:hypothetical protein